MFSCSEVLARHSEYLDGELTTDERAAFHSHLAECASCARYDRVLRRGVEVLARNPAPQPDAAFRQSLHTRLAREDERMAMRPVSIAATATLSVAAVLLLMTSIPGLLEPQGELPPATAHAGVGALTASEVAWQPVLGVQNRWSHTALSAPDVSLTPITADIEVLDHGYSPLILEAPTAPPTYINAVLTYDTR